MEVVRNITFGQSLMKKGEQGIFTFIDIMYNTKFL